MKAVMKKRYSAEFRAQAVELVRLGKPSAVLAKELCIGTSVLYRWLGEGPHSNVVRTDATPGAGDLPPEVELCQLRREDANLKLENDILKKGRRDPRDQSPAALRAMIQSVAEHTGASLHKVCAVLGLPRSSFYHAATPTPRARAEGQIGDLVESIFKRHRRRYGYRRLAQELADAVH